MKKRVVVKPKPNLRKALIISLITLVSGAVIVSFLFHYNLSGLSLAYAGTYAPPYTWNEYLLVNITCLIFIPMLIIFTIFRENPQSYGLMRPQNDAAKIALWFFLLMLPILIIASRFPAFRNYYPIQKEAIYSVRYFLYFEITYGFYLFCWEFFFRGFLTFGLEKRLGSITAVILPSIAFCALHWTKPIPEFLGSFIAGIAMGWLALRGKSFLPGFWIHWGISVIFDILCIHGAPRAFL